MKAGARGCGRPGSQFPHDALRRLGCALLAAFFPPRCSACGAWIDPPVSVADDGGLSFWAGVLCDACRQTVKLIDGPLCSCCGQPFDMPQGRDHLCGRCLHGGQPYAMARSAGIYAGPLKVLVHRLKYDGRLQVARPMGELLRETFLRQWAGRKVDAIVPVPLHRRRLRERGFNQARAMVGGWGRSGPWPNLSPVDIPVISDILVRTRYTVPQAGLERRDRVRNVRAAFRVDCPAAVAGRSMLIVDDVMTTGATVCACAEALHRAGARRVDVLTLARAL